MEEEGELLPAEDGSETGLTSEGRGAASGGAVEEHTGVAFCRDNFSGAGPIAPLPSSPQPDCPREACLELGPSPHWASAASLVVVTHRLVFPEKHLVLSSLSAWNQTAEQIPSRSQTKFVLIDTASAF